jgi:hypothetical protein
MWARVARIAIGAAGHAAGRVGGVAEQSHRQGAGCRRRGLRPG